MKQDKNIIEHAPVVKIKFLPLVTLNSEIKGVWIDEPKTINFFYRGQGTGVQGPLIGLGFGCGGFSSGVGHVQGGRDGITNTTDEIAKKSIMNKTCR